MMAVLTEEQLVALIERAVRKVLEEARSASGLLTTDEAGEIAGVGAKTIRAWVSEGRLPVEKRCGRRLFFRREEVLAARHRASEVSADSLAESLRGRSP